MKKLTAIFLSLIMVAAICVSSAILSFAEDVNLALNKPLEGINPIDGDDTRKGNLTDGKHPEPKKGWMVGSGEAGAEDYMIIVKDKNANADGVAEGVIDLGASCEISEVKVYIGTSLTNLHVKAPNVTVSLSNDGKTYAEFGKYVADTSADAKDFWDFVTISGTKTTARYAKVTFTLDGSYALVAEVQVMGAVSTSEGNTSSADSSATEATSSEATSSVATSSEATSSEATSSEAAPSVATSSADTSSTTPATPSTGDAGVIAVVILAVAAAFGSAVVVKARR